HSAWRGGTPREHCFEFLAFGEFRYGFVPPFLPIELNTLLVYGTHLDLLGVQLPLVCHDLYALYGLELAYHLDFVERTPGKIIRASEPQCFGGAQDIHTMLLRRGLEPRRGVHHIPHHSVVHAHGRAHIAGDDFSRTDANTHAHLVHQVRPFVSLSMPFLAQSC